MAQITIKTDSYNERRYNKPWIAKITFDAIGKANFKFGNWVGKPGEGGVLILENMEEGEIYARGQIDTRKSYNSAPQFFIYHSDESIRVTKLKAFKHFIAREAFKHFIARATEKNSEAVEENEK